MRDLTKRQYETKMVKRGFSKGLGMGYWELPIEGRRINVSDWNAGNRYRSKLAYMIKQLKRNEAEGKI